MPHDRTAGQKRGRYDGSTELSSRLDINSRSQRQRRDYTINEPRYGHVDYHSRGSWETPNRDLHSELRDRRESKGKDVWKRIERFHPYHRTQGRNKSPLDRGRDTRYVHETGRDSRYKYDTVPHSHQKWRPKRGQGYGKGETQPFDTPNSRISAPSRGSLHLPTDSQRTLSENRNRVGDDLYRPSGHLVVYSKETEEERRRKLKGKAHVTEASQIAEKRERDLLLGRKLGSLSIQEPHQPRNIRPQETNPVLVQRDDIMQDNGVLDSRAEDTLLDDEEGEFTADDFAQMEEDLEAQRIDDEMLENDDLLGDELEQEAEQIEAISQLSPEKPKTKVPKKVRVESPALPSKTMQITSSQPAVNSRRKVNQSPTTRSKLASKKLASLGVKASPKKKPGASRASTLVATAQHVPRHEVYPSAISKKLQLPQVRWCPRNHPVRIYEDNSLELSRCKS
ncbi:unnamed protein product [Microthlaspi erraticum]|uniref:Uncharacterized protein n=1 Tax=Microthlaspi erraticum TaxID=1685480 RepID=A0A6D2IMY6_9BRAS|nr:unnamed protein product [Microthlaspi erraticum]